MIVDVIHPGKKSVSKYFVEPDLVVVFGLKSAFGGRGSSGFALIYYNMPALRSLEPKYRQTKLGRNETEHARQTRKMKKSLLRKRRAKRKVEMNAKKINYYYLRGSW
jgi:small subunit ribosomal protein S24e